MADNKINVGGRLHSIATGNVLGGANEIFDDSKNKKQSDINTETYSLVNDVNERLSGLSPDQQSALTVAAKATNNETKLGYYVCGTEGNLAAKVISDATGYILSKGGSIKIKMTNANTANNATLNINSTGAKALYYDGERASAKNSWEAGETVEVYYDGTNFYANNVAGGGGDGVFDVSEKYPTSGVEGGNTYTLDGALAVLNANLPTSKKKGGMSIKFVQSSDNKYVQCRCTKQTFSANPDDWENISDIKNGLEKQITTLYESGKGIFDILNFKHGSILVDAVFDASIKYRVCTPIEITIPYATKVKAATGFRFFYYKYSGDAWSGIEWKTKETFNGGEIVKICIGREIEDTSEIADIQEFASSLSFTTFISESGKSLDISRQNLNSSQKLYETGDGIPPFEFARGSLSNGNLNEDILYRVSTVEFNTAERDSTIIAKAGFRFGIAYYDGSTIVDSGWKTTYNIEKGLVYKIQIGREPENTSEIADVLEFVNSLTMTTIISDISKSLDISLQNLNSSCKLYGTGKGTPPFEFARGALFNDNLEESILYRVSQVSFETAERDYYLTIKSGYKFGIVYYNGDSIVYTGWEHSYLINKGLVFKIQVARDQENTSEVADIYEYVSALTMTTYISDLSEAVFSNVLPNYFRKINRLQYTGTAFQRVRAFSNLKLDKDTTYLFKVKYDSALTSTAYVYLMKSDNTEYKTYSIGASGTTEYDFMITPSENLVDAYINVAFAQTSVAADFEISKLPAIHTVVDMNRQSISRKNLPAQTIAVGHTGAHSGVYPSNSIENAMYNVLNNGFKAIEVDVKMTADYIPVLAHEQTVIHEGQTYQINDITFAQATEFGLKPFEPYLVCSKRYGFSLWVDSPFSMSDYKNQCDALVAMMHKYGSTQHIMIIVNYAQIPAMRYLTTLDNTIGIGLIYFRRSFMTESDVMELKNLTNGEVCIEMELDNAITPQDTDYINYWRAKGFSFGMFTIYNNNNPVERTKEWADLVDYIVTEYEHTPELLMEYDFPS